MSKPSNPSHDLLFGLLALQTGLIDQGALFAAFAAWTRDRSRSLADHLVALCHLDATRRAAVEAIAAVHLQTLGGDIEKSLAVLAVGRSIREGLVCAGGPDVEATLGHVGSAHPPTHADGDDPDRTASLSVGSATSEGQRFRILRPHARGGLGAVFVALDSELNREVALKQILEKHADDSFSRERFIAEAEITGALEHPGVVPVYGLGTDAGGRPFYAMRFIKGDSLKTAIERFHADELLMRDAGRKSLELRKLLRRFIDVCNAVDYAHSRGVIHRDLKPANIIVGKHGETLVVDWGLAKSVGRADPTVGEQTIAPSSSGSSETLPGSALGTPAYMSPEQARGDLNRLGPRSDVCSLGATLYCILTGKPPFEGEDIGAILNAVQEGQFPRPSRLDPSIDRALEAVCLKAMATAPEDRYATARALADDLDRWMADEPVTAWKEPRTRTLLRWLTRHRTGVTGAAAAALAGVVGLSAVLAVQSVANARLSESLQRETNANAELKSSKAAVQARYDLAVEAIKTFHTGVSEDFLLKEDQFKELRDRLLKSASDFYGKLGALLGKETEFDSRRALAQSNFELAELTGKVGRYEAALTAHRAVLAAREALAAERGDDTTLKVDVGQSLTAVAWLLSWTGKTEEGLTANRRAESLLADVAGSDQTARAALATCRTQMARLLMEYRHKPAEALAACRLARADQEALAAVPGASNDARRDLAATVNELGLLLSVTGKPAEAEVEHRTALAIQQKLADENPTVTDFRNSLANSHIHLAYVLLETGQPAEVEAQYRTALAIYQKLAGDNPAVTKFRRNLALSHYLMSQLMRETGKPLEAEAEVRTAVAIAQKLADDNPAVTDFRNILAIIHMDLGILLLQMGKPPEAEVECHRALEISQKLADESPAVGIFRGSLAWGLINLGDAVRSLGRAAESKGCYERAITLEEPHFREDPTHPWYRQILVLSLRRRGLAQSDLGAPSAAAADARRALGMSGGLTNRDMWTSFETACCHAALAGLAGRAGSCVSAAEGEIEAAKAMDYLRRAVAMGYRNANEVRIEAALDPLRSRDDFRLLMMDVAFPTELFDALK